MKNGINTIGNSTPTKRKDIKMVTINDLKEVPLGIRVAKQRHKVTIALSKLQREYAQLETLMEVFYRL